MSELMQTRKLNVMKKAMALFVALSLILPMLMPFTTVRADSGGDGDMMALIYATVAIFPDCFDEGADNPRDNCCDVPGWEAKLNHAVGLFQLIDLLVVLARLVDEDFDPAVDILEENVLVIFFLEWARNHKEAQPNFWRWFWELNPDNPPWCEECDAPPEGDDCTCGCDCSVKDLEEQPAALWIHVCDELRPRIVLGRVAAVNDELIIDFMNPMNVSQSLASAVIHIDGVMGIENARWMQQNADGEWVQIPLLDLATATSTRVVYNITWPHNPLTP
jgi:hypothetical protein